MLNKILFLILFIGLFVDYCSADANTKLKTCCSKNLERGDDEDCITRFCDFEGISQANVRNCKKFKYYRF